MAAVEGPPSLKPIMQYVKQSKQFAVRVPPRTMRQCPPLLLLLALPLCLSPQDP